MAKVVLISCASKKLNEKTSAKGMYISPLFKKSLKYAESISPDRIFILSAEYSLLKLDQQIMPYNKTLNKMRTAEIKQWADSVLKQLKRKTDLENDLFIFLAGENYRKFLLPHIRSYKIPMKGLGIGKQLQWLTKMNKNE